MTPLPSPGIHWCEVMTVDWMGNGVLAFLAAVGIAALVWLVTGVILRRRPPEVPAVLVLPACGGAEALEGWVRTLLEVRAQLGRSAEIAVVDCGLTAEGARRVQLLAQRFDKIMVLDRGELDRIIE